MWHFSSGIGSAEGDIFVGVCEHVGSTVLEPEKVVSFLSDRLPNDQSGMSLTLRPMGTKIK